MRNMIGAVLVVGLACSVGACKKPVEPAAEPAPR